MSIMRPPCIRWSTGDVAAPDRIDYWNSKNTAVLVGLRSISFDEEDGLVAQQASFDLDGVRMSDISGNQHVIERHSDLIRTHPKSSVFASLVLRSEGFFYQGKACHTLKPGDLLIYDTQRPYMIGFTEQMRQFVFDCPASMLELSPDTLKQPIKIDGGSGSDRWLAAALRHQGWRLTQMGPDEDMQEARSEILALLQSMVSRRLNDGAAAGFSASYVAAARSYVARHLDDPDLQVEKVAQALGVSSRHLNRVFGLETQETVARYIRHQRLEAARRDLSDPRLSGLDVTAIACKWGFVSQSHFTRVFREAYGLPPGQYRAAPLPPA